MSKKKPPSQRPERQQPGRFCALRARGVRSGLTGLAQLGQQGHKAIALEVLAETHCGLHHVLRALKRRLHNASLERGGTNALEFAGIKPGLDIGMIGVQSGLKIGLTTSAIYNGIRCYIITCDITLLETFIIHGVWPGKSQVIRHWRLGESWQCNRCPKCNAYPGETPDGEPSGVEVCWMNVPTEDLRDICFG